MRILISGAGIAGPALAYWVHRHGMEAVVVERAPALREGGQAVDFRGPVHREVLERMDLWDAITARRTRAEPLAVLDAKGRRIATMPEFLLGGDVEIARGDLSCLLYERTRTFTEYRLGDRVVDLEDRGDAVHVQFERSRPERFDLVVGADGLHSGVRALGWGDEARLLRHQGYRLASFDVDDEVLCGLGALLWSSPGIGVSLNRTRDPRRARASMFFVGPPLDERRSPIRSVHDAFARAGWEIPRFLRALDAASDVYVDAITLVDVDRFARGRLVLLGDAAWGGTLGGQGTPLAIVGACVLAHELARRATVGEALARYEREMRPYAMRGQAGARHVGGFHAPRTRLALAIRNAWMRLFTTRALLGVFRHMVTRRADDFLLPASIAPS